MLYREELTGLTRYLARHAGCEDEAVDLAQDAFVALTLARPEGAVRNPAALLQRIARNLLSNHLRRRRRWMALVSRSSQGDDVASIPPPQSIWIEAEELMDQYRRALEELPQKTRTVFMMHRVEELSYLQIAEQLGISVKTVEYHIAAALKHLDIALDRK